MEIMVTTKYIPKPPPVARSISTKERGGKLLKTSSLEEPSPAVTDRLNAVSFVLP
jgi:hypothetical protein